MDSNIKRDIILDNYNNPLNRSIPDNTSDYIKFNSRNNSCIDNLDIYIKIKNNFVEDIKYQSEACVICTAATSILSNLLIGKTIDEAKEIISNYHNMVEEKEYDDKLLKESIVFDDIYKQPSRKTCATLFSGGLANQLEKLEKKP